MGPGSGGTCDKLGHSPNSVVTKNLTVRVKAGCPIGGAHIRVRQIRCYLRYIHSPRDLRSAFRLRSFWCTHFWISLYVADAKGNLIFWWSKVDFCWQVQEIGAALLRCADFAAGAVLWRWGRSDFVAGEVNRDFWTCGLLAEVQASWHAQPPPPSPPPPSPSPPPSPPSGTQYNKYI